MNILLLAVLIALACIAALIRLSPGSMKELAAWLIATAESDEERRRFFEHRHATHRREMGLPAREVRKVVEMPERAV